MEACKNPFGPAKLAESIAELSGGSKTAAGTESKLSTVPPKRPVGQPRSYQKDFFFFFSFFFGDSNAGTHLHPPSVHTTNNIHSYPMGGQPYTLTTTILSYFVQHHRSRPIFCLPSRNFFFPNYIRAKEQVLPPLAPVSGKMKTRIAKVKRQKLGFFANGSGLEKLETWVVDAECKESLVALGEAAEYLRSTDTPVGFPTETVYGLGADATRSAAVKGIYTAKGRPSDNPLIVHVCDLDMLRNLLGPNAESKSQTDLIPEIYKPLIEKFWPGPLTILLPNATPSKLAPEVTPGLSTFGARMPASSLARSLIKLTGAPLAAPSANASTKPSPTTAQHVLDDLDGRIELILDGGPCQVGLESTVVDGLCSPPVVLRPGGVSTDEIRSCEGWEGVVKAYKDQSEIGKAAPRAPGMKYKHYSPKAKVVLYEATSQIADQGPAREDVQAAFPCQNGDAATKTNGYALRKKRMGIIRTRRWGQAGGLPCGELEVATNGTELSVDDNPSAELPYEVLEGDLYGDDGEIVGRILDIDLGRDIKGIAQGLFSALRELDRRGVEIIFVDGVDDQADIAAAVMNRLRKAATEIRA
jgi:L-threonylcarbamoyladenylate synthase